MLLVRKIASQVQADDRAFFILDLFQPLAKRLNIIGGIQIDACALNEPPLSDPELLDGHLVISDIDNEGRS